MGLVEVTYVTCPDEPCNVGGEVRPPKVVDNVCTCCEVSMMSGGIMGGSENFWSPVAVDDYFMMALWIPPPNATILLKEVLGIAQKHGVCGIGESQGMFHGAEPIVNMLQMVVGLLGSLRLGE